MKMASKPVFYIAGYDTETTGLEIDKGDRAIEFASLIMDICQEKIVYKHVQRYDPKCPIHPRAQAVHGISYAELAGKPDFAVSIPTIQKMAKLSPVWLAHNAKFDSMVLAAEFNIAKVPLPEITVLDSMDSRWATPNGKSPNLRELCFSLGVDYDPAKAHAAEYDVLVMLSAWLRGFKRGFFTHPHGTYESMMASYNSSED